MSRKWAKIQEWALSESLIHYEMEEEDVENALGSSGQMQGGVGGGESVLTHALIGVEYSSYSEETEE